MAGRPYTVTFQNVSVSAIQDLFNLAGPAAGSIEIKELNLFQKALGQFEMERITLRKMTATVTNGTGGSAATPGKHLNGDAAATATCRVNDATTQASSTGINLIVREDMWMVMNPYQYVPSDYNDRLILGASQNFVARLENAPSTALSVSGSLVFEELF